MQTHQIVQLPAFTQLLAVCLSAFAVSGLAYPAYINFLKKKQVEQYLREDGPQSHAHKAKTPTIGGLVFAIATTVICITGWFLFGIDIGFDAFSIFAVALICSALGFFDDYAKFTSRSNKGISGYIRLGSELALGLALGVVLVLSAHQILLMPFPEPFINQIAALIGGEVSHAGSSLRIWVPPMFLFVVLSSFMIAATSNAINLHDGMDGLAAGTSCQVFATMALMLYDSGQLAYALMAASAAGALCGFLLVNKNPAKIFMGDTGSLFIGGLMGGLAVAGGLVVWFIPLSLVYIIEVISVVLQVTYFKLTKKLEGEEKMPLFKVVLTKLTKRLPGEGKRLFRMAPLHHHYEAVLAEKGVEEWQVVAGFWIVQFVICLAVIAGYFAFGR